MLSCTLPPDILSPKWKVVACLGSQGLHSAASLLIPGAGEEKFITLQIARQTLTCLLIAHFLEMPLQIKPAKKVLWWRPFHLKRLLPAQGPCSPEGNSPASENRVALLALRGFFVGLLQQGASNGQSTPLHKPHKVVPS